jgi:hypothetical protein
MEGPRRSTSLGSSHLPGKDSRIGTRRASVQGKCQRWQHTMGDPRSPRPPITSEMLDSCQAPWFYIPPPRHVVDFLSLGSFHPCGSDCPAEEARLTRREASTSSSPWLPGVGSEGKKRSHRRDRRHCIPRAPLYSPSRCTMSGSRPSNQPSTTKEPSGNRPGVILIPAAHLRAVA